jgi:uncharacterized membrane protein
VYQPGFAIYITLGIIMNLDFDAFTYITGIAGLLGLALQLKDSFPEHREMRRTVVLLVIGVFIGSVVASLKGVKVEFGASISPFEILIAVFVAVLAVVAIAGAFTREPTRRAELFMFSGLGTLALFFLLFFGGLGSLEADRAERDRKQVSVEELIELSSLNASRGSYERAILFLDDAKSRLPQKDERRALLEERVRELKRKQIGAK